MPAFQPLSSNKRKYEEEEQSTNNKRVSHGNFSPSLVSEAEVWMVQWRKPQYKKHKTWDGDGILVGNGNEKCTLYDMDGNIIASEKVFLPLSEGKKMSFGNKEIEVERPISRDEFLSGSCFGSNSVSRTSLNSGTLLTKRFNPPSLNLFPAKDNSQGYDDELNQGPKATRGPLDITNHPLHWTANWRKPKERKNKTWDGDAYVSCVSDKLVLLSEEGKMMGSIPWKGQPLHAGFSTLIGGKEVELDMAISESQLPTANGQESNSIDTTSPSTSDVSQPSRYFISPVSFYATKPKVKGPRHDPNAPGALVMTAPSQAHIKRFNKKNLPIVPVVVDPILSSKMRPHQREGVQFLYECVLGMRKFEGQGCILADEMGLGKTLQTIALVWTLLRQNPYAGIFPVVQKVLIVCPVSLVNNWKAEFYKWLGRDRVGIVACDKTNAAIEMFGHSKVHEVLIIGYERLRTIIDKLSNIHPPIGLIICDEGHRLKSASNKTAAVFKTLNTRKRIILSGTPIQNDLSEFHAMADFCNPGLLDDYAVFRKVYETPILKSRMPGATQKEIEIGEVRSTQLLSIAKSFVLRRDASLLKNHLPPKTEYVVFVTPTQLQLLMFSKILQPAHLADVIQSSTAESLALINLLNKISNSPILLKATMDNAKGKDMNNQNSDSFHLKAVRDALQHLPEGAEVADMKLSGKLIFLSQILDMLRHGTEEKCVLVSHYTSTLNILEAYCKKMSYSYYRLDGQTPQNKRQEYVNAFNKGTQRNSFVFLLSSKAGGVGINLIGASRLFIIDSDWNPSHDLQSMARCHRDGQKCPVFIYRLLTTGTIDEKIYQRQVTKLGLSESLIGSNSSSSKSDSFTRKDLRDIFRVHPNTSCNTHDLLQCECDGDAYSRPQDDVPGNRPEARVGFVNASDITKEDLQGLDQTFLQKKREGLAALGEWKHLNCLQPCTTEGIHDDILRKMCSQSSPGNRTGNLLSSIDLDAIQAMESASIRDVPGGTVSFLFEKCPTASLEIE